MKPARVTTIISKLVGFSYFNEDLDTEIVIAAARGPNPNTIAVSANLVVDERQMNALFLRCGKQ